MLTRKKRKISKREKQVLTYIAKGYSSKDIANVFYLSVYTIESHRKNIIEKFKAENITHAVASAIREKVIR